MLNYIWLGMILLSILFGMINGRISTVVESIQDKAALGFTLALTLAGIMAFWLGIMAIAEKSGLIQKMSRWLSPIMRRLFPQVPVDHPAMGDMTMSIIANILGIGNATTPLGIKAMKSLQQLNSSPSVATNAMCMFLAINTSSVQLIPTTVLTLFVKHKVDQSMDLVLTTLLATVVSTVVAIVVCRWFSKMKRYRLDRIEETT